MYTLLFCLYEVANPSEQEINMYSVLKSKFHPFVESCREKIRKPNPLIWTIACERADVKPCNCIFIDDLRMNCSAASKLGMQTVLVPWGGKYLNCFAAIFELLPVVQEYFELHRADYDLVAEYFAALTSNL